MSKIEKTVFISYRRTDVYTALAVDQYLKSQGFDVFFDYTSIPSGDFEQVIVSNIKARAHFVIILTPTALDRCVKPGDWLKREIETAMEEKRNIVPLFFKGFRFSSSGLEKLMGKLKNLSRYNGLNIHEDYFHEGMDRLQRQFLNVPLDTVLHPVPAEVQKIVEKEQAEADKSANLLEPELLPKPEIKDAAPSFESAADTPSEEASSDVVGQELEAIHDVVSESAGSPLSDTLAFYPTIELVLRKQPVASPDTAIRRIPITEQLVSVEDPSVAVPKIGMEGKWLKVKDTSNTEGYVAAWLIRFAGPASVVSPQDQLALTPIAKLSLRTRPVISPETAIRRIPVTEQLICMEPVDQAIPKIGVEGQWLRVKDEMGRVGYIAAWLVVR
jgi:hypothetical protein